MPLRKKKYIKKKKKSIEATRSFPCKSKSLGKDVIIVGSGLLQRSLCPDAYKKSLHKNENNKEGVRRIPLPFNQFASKDLQIADRKTYNSMGHHQIAYQCTGLSPKEKTYVICSCQKRLKRYLALKQQASTAIKENKIFSIYGNFSAVRKALLERGWVEKLPPNRMNLSRIQNGTFMTNLEKNYELERLLLSTLVEKCDPNFIWRSKDHYREPQIIDMNKPKCKTIINKLKTDAQWTTKQGLCSSMKRNYWFYIENVAEVNGPRTYNSYDVGEIEGFVKDYKITACTSLLKWVISMVANNKPVFVESGKMTLNVLVFALDRCKDYLFQKQHKDIDRSLNTASAGQWRAFLKKYYRIISKKDVFQEDKTNKLPLYLGYAKFLLKEIHKFRPQLRCEGCHNIWIIKPAHCSRGRGIRMASKLGVITNLLTKANAKYVIQKYIEEPLLIHDTKFDIRQYYLVTSTFPLVIWMYTDCYLKFSSQKYSLTNYHESIHLTNNAIQRRYKNCKGRHSELPQNNMWDSQMYKAYLKKNGKGQVWDSTIYPGMKKSIIGIMLSCQDSLTVCKNRFELYGCDFILDNEFKPWLIEINSCPDLNHTTQVTAKICPAVISDIIKVVIDYARNSSSSTGKFECIYRQPISIPRYGCAADFAVRGYTLPLDYFYRGNVKIEESYDDPDIGKERNIKAIYNKLKHFYEADRITMQTDDNDDTPSKHSNEALSCDHNTTSENELSLVASVITEQLDEVVGRITSANSFSSMSDRIKCLPSPAHSSRLMVKRMKSVTNIETLLQSPCSCFASLESLNFNSVLEKKNSSNKLDDSSSPQGKGGFAELNSIKKLFDNTANIGIKEDTKKTQDDVIDATAKIISFINQKEKEYFQDIHK